MLSTWPGAFFGVGERKKKPSLARWPPVTAGVLASLALVTAVAVEESLVIECSSIVDAVVTGPREALTSTGRPRELEEQQPPILGLVFGLEVRVGGRVRLPRLLPEVLLPLCRLV